MSADTPHVHDWINEETNQPDHPVANWTQPDRPYYRDPTKWHWWKCRVCGERRGLTQGRSKRENQKINQPPLQTGDKP